MGNSTLSKLKNDFSVEQHLENYLPHCTLKWRQGQLFVNRGQQSKQPYIYAFESKQQLVQCLKQSPVRLVRLDPTLGEAVVKRWADACEQANKPVFLPGAIQKRPKRQSQFSRQRKQWIDWIAAFVLLLALGPIMLATAILMYVYSPEPIFSRQWHLTPRGKFFRLLKFRTAVVNDDSRTTSLIHWMRNYNVDKLPTLFHVLRGEFSLMDLLKPLTVSEAVQFSLEDSRKVRAPLSKN
ncbi:sugar transferase [Funiculus sociatus GB2-A5]|uniref:Sugar transferase n=1 Tax=Funiculus sociatus GB2-A5 TaxID=2933946 RepID=A0ABV0JVP8_9CYAN|nr:MULTISPECIES: heterocyst development glycosyltransferase HepC [unclassified Trichocoleus]MBD1907410.1 sugar transferase [Trichocoleus sp. FACHB-832]MBD2063187.1 sugar transferase [Trichocoleus sp. FACHB-6]